MWFRPPVSGDLSVTHTSVPALDRLRELEEKVAIAKQALEIATRALEEVKAETKE
jgi:hypothetical protein